MAMDKQTIRDALYYGNSGKNSHMIVACDTFEWEDYIVFVKFDEDINEEIAKYNGKNMQRIEEVYNYSLDLELQLNEFRAYHVEPYKINISERAKKYATEKHKGQPRKNGDEYISHPIGVAELVIKYKKSHNIDVLTAAAYLHDVLEQTDATYYELVDLFGYDVASIVMELTTNEEMKDAIGKERYLAYKLKHMTSWALVIKLCDRLHNISDLDLQDESFRNRYIGETLYILNYIIDNRELSDTHKAIIRDIRLGIDNVMKRVSEKSKKLVK
jgi:(p)ppGpp synthase/HD superfamily hydrolase